MYSPTSRVLTVLEWLQARPHMSGVELAERLEVDQRTVRRYITMLQDMGIPIESKRGRYGMYRLRPGTKVPPLIFRNDEAFALTLGLLTTRKMGLAVTAPAVESALAKVERALPRELREHVRAIQDTIIFDFDVAKSAPVSDIVVTLCVAVQQKHRVWLRYRSYNAQEETEREVDPYGVACIAGFWYMVGYCHLRQDVRVFRLDRTLAAEMREETFVPPERFDVLAHVTRSIAMMPTTWLVDVLLETTMEKAQCMISPTMATLEQEEGGVAMRCYVQQLEWFAPMLIDLRCPFIVRQPDELRSVLLRLSEQIAQMAARRVATK